jgi:hypothetical protein
MPAAFAAMKQILRPGGRFVVNIGGSFAGLSSPSLAKPTLSDLINAVAARDYFYDPPTTARGPILTPAMLAGQLDEAGFTVTEQRSLLTTAPWRRKGSGLRCRRRWSHTVPLPASACTGGTLRRWRGGRLGCGRRRCPMTGRGCG